MSSLQGKVSGFEIAFDSIPRGAEGSTEVTVNGGKIPIRWKRDAYGIWIEFPHQVRGYDISASRDDDGRLQYRVSRRGGDETWTGVSFLRAGEQEAAAAGRTKKKGSRVRSQMPGKIVKILVKSGDAVEKDQPLLVMEAMKMENEIRALQAGIVGQVHVQEGQAVETGADLLVIG